MKTRIIAFIMLVLILTCSFVGCGNVGGETGTTENGAAGTTAATPDETTESPYGTLGEKNWQGKEFKVLGLYASNEPSMEIDFAETDGDIMHDKVYSRNREIEALFNVKISQVGDENLYGKF